MMADVVLDNCLLAVEPSQTLQDQSNVVILRRIAARKRQQSHVWHASANMYPVSVEFFAQAVAAVCDMMQYHAAYHAISYASQNQHGDQQISMFN